MKKSTKKTKLSTIQVLKYRKPAGRRKNSHRVDFIFSCMGAGEFASPMDAHYGPGNSLYKNGLLHMDVPTTCMSPFEKGYIYRRHFAKEAFERYFK